MAIHTLPSLFPLVLLFPYSTHHFLNWIHVLYASKLMCSSPTKLQRLPKFSINSSLVMCFHSDFFFLLQMTSVTSHFMLICCIKNPIQIFHETITELNPMTITLQPSSYHPSPKTVDYFDSLTGVSHYTMLECFHMPALSIQMNDKFIKGTAIIFFSLPPSRPFLVM